MEPPGRSLAGSLRSVRVSHPYLCNSPAGRAGRSPRSFPAGPGGGGPRSPRPAPGRRRSRWESELGRPTTCTQRDARAPRSSCCRALSFPSPCTGPLGTRRRRCARCRTPHTEPWHGAAVSQREPARHERVGTEARGQAAASPRAWRRVSGEWTGTAGVVRGGRGGVTAQGSAESSLVAQETYKNCVVQEADPSPPFPPREHPQKARLQTATSPVCYAVRAGGGRGAPRRRAGRGGAAQGGARRS